MRKHLLLVAAPLLLAACQGDVTGDVIDSQPVVQEAAPADTLQDPGLSVSEPAPDAEVGSPIAVRGEARASWFGPERTFPVQLQDEAGNVLVDLYATALTDVSPDGMTAFETFLDFSGSSAERGMLVLKKADPSGDPNAAGSIIIPVRLVR